jgi:hypothetical protein
MSVVPVNLTASGTTDASGNLSLLVHGLTPLAVSIVNVYCTLSGSSAQVNVLMAGVTPAGTAYGSNAQLGPVIVANQSGMTVQIVGASAKSLVVVQVTGYSATSMAELPPLSGPTPNSLLLGGPVSITGPVAITGPVTVEQFNPSDLLVGQVGPPIVENQVTAVGAGGSAYVFGNPTPVSIAGYGALLLHVTGTSGGEMWGQLVWYDQGGSVITYTDIGSLGSGSGLGFIGVIAAISSAVAFQLFEPGGAGSVTSTVIPLVSAPAHPDQLIDNGAAGAASPFPDSRTLINIQSVVGAGLTVTTQANFVWPGRAVLSVVTTGATFDCKLFSTDALNNVTQIVRIQNQPGALAQTVQLTSALVSISFNNGGAGNLTPFISLIATS